MVSPPLFLSCPTCLKIEIWYSRKSGLEDFFHPGDEIKIADCGEKGFRVSWQDENCYMDLQWDQDKQKLNGKGVPICNKDGTSLCHNLTVTIFKSPHPTEVHEWIGELTKLYGNGANTGVFIAQQDPQPPPYGPRDEKGTSTEE